MQEAIASSDDLRNDSGDLRIWLRALRDPEPALRARAARELGEMGDHRAIPDLRDALRDPDQEVRKAAAMALGSIVNLAE